MLYKNLDVRETHIVVSQSPLCADLFMIYHVVSSYTLPNMNQKPPKRTIFYISDGTGITAETFGNAILKQFELTAQHIRLPFVNTPEKIQETIEHINQAAQTDGARPIVFSTLVNDDAVWNMKTQSEAIVLDMFGTFMHPLELELGIKSNHSVGRFSDINTGDTYKNRIEAINFSLAHDDGQTHANLAQSDIILVGVSRSGKTPTSLYLAMQYGLKVANYPLIPEDFDRQQLPTALQSYKHKLYGLSIAPERLSEIRSERRPNSKYSSLINCRDEVSRAEAMMRRAGVRWVFSTHKSIEEIATTILQDMQSDILNYHQ